MLCDFAGGILSLFQLCLEVRALPQGPPESGPGFRVVATADLAAMSQFVQVLLAGRQLDRYLACVWLRISCRPAHHDRLDIMPPCCPTSSAGHWAIENLHPHHLCRATRRLYLRRGAMATLNMGVQAAVMRDASLVTGDPAKLGLGIVSLVYDSVLLAQHFVIFPAAHSTGGPLTGLSSQTSFKLQTF